MTPSEHDATVAVDAAARKLYESVFDGEEEARPFDDLDPLQKRHLREQVLPFVWAALEALPDREELREEFGRRIKDGSMGNGHMKGHVSSLYRTREEAVEGIAGGRGVFADQEIVVRRVTEWEPADG